KGLANRSVDVKLDIIHSVCDEKVRNAFKAAAAGDKEAAKLRDAAEDLLAGLLDDKSQRFGMSGTWNNKSYSNPRVCDMAAHALYMRDADRFFFDLEKSLAERRRMIAVLKNAWRKERQLAELPIPEPKLPAAVPDETLKPLLDQFVSGKAE